MGTSASQSRTRGWRSYHISSDAVSVALELCRLAGAIIIALASYRAYLIGGSLVGRVYRNRAYWLSALCAGGFLTSVTGLIPLLASDGISFLFLIILAFFVFAFLDSTILVELDLDLFHRNTLRWRQLRMPFYALVAVFVLVLIVLFALPSKVNIPAWLLDALYLLLGIVAVTYLYSIAALVVGEKRTWDKTLKYHVRWLALAIIVFLVVFLNDFTLSSDVLNALGSLLAVYLLYRAVMSLSLLGRIKKEVRTEP